MNLEDLKRLRVGIHWISEADFSRILKEHASIDAGSAKGYFTGFLADPLWYIARIANEDVGQALIDLAMTREGTYLKSED